MLPPIIRGLISTSSFGGKNASTFECIVFIIGEFARSFPSGNKSSEASQNIARKRIAIN